MADKTLFRAIPGALLPGPDALNEAGGAAYRLSAKGALAQYAATGCLAGTYYASAREQLERTLALAAKVEAAFVAKAAVYARERAWMKDMPALLLVHLSVREPDLFARAFPRVVTDGRMLRTFVQILRSGTVARRSLGSRPKRLVRDWLASRTPDQLFRAAVGRDPSLADVVKMVHPKPDTAERRALHGHLLGKAHDAALLPDLVKALEAFRSGARGEVPDVPFALLTSLPLGRREWASIARKASWQTTRMNLATFARHGVFEDAGMAELIADRLRDRAAITRARAFPYQLLATRVAATDVPRVVRDALDEAMDLASENVPVIDGKIYVLPDTSGSMASPITGYRGDATSSVSCLQVAALVTAALLRRNPGAEVLPFADGVKQVRLEPRDTVTTSAAAISLLGGGGTSCSAPLAELNRRHASGELVIYVSDNQSWLDARAGRGTAAMEEWARFRSRNPGAKLVCVDLQPYGTTPACDREDVLNVGGFSDAVFEIIAMFRSGSLSGDHWAHAIEEVTI